MNDISVTVQNASDSFGVRISRNTGLDDMPQPVVLSFIDDTGNELVDKSGLPEQVFLDFDTVRDLARLLPVVIDFLGGAE